MSVHMDDAADSEDLLYWKVTEACFLASAVDRISEAEEDLDRSMSDI